MWIVGKKFFAYCFLLIFGFLGGHHYYLGRYRHGFIYSLTFGGYFIGCIRDVFALSRYVDDVILDINLSKKTKILTTSCPKSSWFRLAGEAVFSFISSMFAYQLIALFTNNNVTLAMGASQGLIFGVYLVGNVPPEAVNFILLQAFSIIPSLLLSCDQEMLALSTALFVLLVNYFAKHWNEEFYSLVSPTKPQMSLSARHVMWIQWIGKTNLLYFVSLICSELIPYIPQMLSFLHNLIIVQLMVFTIAFISFFDSSRFYWMSFLKLEAVALLIYPFLHFSMSLLLPLAVIILIATFEYSIICSIKPSSRSNLLPDAKFVPLRKRMKEDSIVKRSLISFTLIFISMFIWLILGYLLLHSITITSSSGESVKLKDHIFIKEFHRFFYLAYTEIRDSDMDDIWAFFNYLYDPDFENSSLHQIGLKSPTTLAEIRRQCRKLSASHHPDRFKESIDKEKHVEKFQIVRFHCDKLIKIYSEE